MRAIVVITGRMTLLDFICPECGNALEGSEDDVAVMVHPTHDYALLGKGKPITCRNAGKRYKRPTVELEEAK